MALIPLLSGAYSSQSVIANAQRCVNLYPETNPKVTTPPVPVTHYPRPGLVRIGGPVTPEPPVETSGLFVAMTGGESSPSILITSSDDGDSWVELPAGFGVGESLRSITGTSTLLVAAGYDASNAIIRTSDDAGLNWTTQTNSFGFGSINGATYGPDVTKFVVGGASGSVGHLEYASITGDDWTSADVSATFGGAGIFDGFILTAYWSDFDGIFLIGGLKRSGDGGIMTSPDAINWTDRANGFTGGSLAFVNGFGSDDTGIILAVGNDNSGGGIVQKSTNAGASWTTKTFDNWAGASAGVNGVSFGNSVAVAVGSDNSGAAHFERSTDGGETWAEVDVSAIFGGAFSQGVAIAFDSVVEQFVVTGDDDADAPIVAVSDDGLTWEKKTDGVPEEGSGTSVLVLVAS